MSIRGTKYTPGHYPEQPRLEPIYKRSFPKLLLQGSNPEWKSQKSKIKSLGHGDRQYASYLNVQCHERKLNQKA